MTVTESDYKVAQVGDAKVRQEFLDEIGIGLDGDIVMAEYISPNHQMVRQSLENYGVTLYELFAEMGCDLPAGAAKSLIFVLPEAFSNFSYHYFMNVFIGHELHHARQFSHGLRKKVESLSPVISPNDFKYIHCLAEIPALRNQMFDATQRNLTMGEAVKTNKRMYETEFWARKWSSILERDWKKDLAKILCPSPFDDVVREKYSLD